MSFSFKKVFSSLNKIPDQQSKKVVGIDFGSSTVKVVELELRDNVITLTTYGELQLGPYADAEMGNCVTLPIEKRIEAVVDVIRESGVTAKKGVLALQLSDSFVTVISLAAKEGENIAPRVRVEARKYVPVPITDVALEWSEIQPLGDNPPLTREILLAAIQNDALSGMTSILNSIQMASLPFEIELFSTLRAATKDTDSSLAVIDIGANMSKLYITEAGFLRRIHRAQVGGAHITKTIAQKLDVPFEVAENTKRNYTPESVNATEIKKIVTSTFERPLQEFKRVINQYELRTGRPISRIVCTGGSASLQDLVSHASYIFDTEVEVVNPFEKVAYPAFMEDTLKEIAPIFTVAIGASLRLFE